MRAAFLGTPSAAVPSLAALTEIADVAAVVTRPDAPRGRSGRPEPPPVKVAAVEWGLDVAQPADSHELAAALDGLALDIAVVVAYGRLLSGKVLAVTRAGFVNVHFSLLPRWRGAAPVARAILAGDAATGVSLMVLDEDLDTGPVVAVAETEIGEEETAGVLTARLAVLGARLLETTLPAYLAGARTPAPQFEAGVTAAPVLTTAGARLNPEEGLEPALRKVRAYNPKPGAWLSIDGVRVKVWAASGFSGDVPRGHLVEEGGVPVVGFADGGAALDRVQAAGKKPASGAAWWRGRRGGATAVDAI